MTRWPLRVVLDLAVREEAAARRGFAAALATEARRIDEREAAAAALRAHAALESGAQPEASRADRLGTVGAAGSLRASAFHLARLRQQAARLAEELRARDAILAEARGELEARRDVLAAARGAVRALERHREIWREARARRNARAEESAADEIVSGRRPAGS